MAITAATLIGIGVSAAAGAGIGAGTAAAMGGDPAKGAWMGAAGGAVGGAAGGLAGAAGGIGGAAASSAPTIAGATSAAAPMSTGALGSMTGMVGPVASTSGNLASTAAAATPSLTSSALNGAKSILQTVMRPVAGSGNYGANVAAEAGNVLAGGTPGQSLASMAAGGNFAPANAAIGAGQVGQGINQAYNVASSPMMKPAMGMIAQGSAKVQAPQPIPQRKPITLPPEQQAETILSKRTYGIDQNGNLVRL